MPIASILYIIITNGPLFSDHSRLDLITQMDLQELISLAGGDGRFQGMHFFLLGFGNLYVNLETLAVNFLSPAYDHWCSIPALANLTLGEQKQVAIPYALHGYVFLVQNKSFFYVKCLDHFDIIQRLGKNSVLWWYDVRNYNAPNRVIGHWSWAEHGTRFLRRKNLLILMARA